MGRLAEKEVPSLQDLLQCRSKARYKNADLLAQELSKHLDLNSDRQRGWEGTYLSQGSRQGLARGLGGSVSLSNHSS